MKTPDPTFQPVLQVIEIIKEKHPPAATRVRSLNQSRNLLPGTAACALTYKIGFSFAVFQVLVSDGEYFIQGTLSEDVYKMLRRKEIRVNSLIKVTDVGKYKLDGRTAIHINQMTVVSFDSGSRFGNPINIVDRPSNKESKSDDNIGGGLRRLYSHHFPKSETNTGKELSRIPRSGWRVECHGEGPGPSCTWIPATKETRKNSSPRSVAANIQLADSSQSDTDDEEDGTSNNQGSYHWKLDHRRSIAGE